MSEFINTADVIGDDEMCDQIIQRTVTEYKEARISKIGQYAFYGCTALTVVDVPNVTSIEVNSLNGCSALTALILGGDAVVTLANTNALTGSGIAKGTGYVYVPSALLASYQAATNWSTYAAQFRVLEDFETESISIDTAELMFTTSDPQTLVATIVPAERPITWTSSNLYVARVSDDGVVTPIADGVAIITASGPIGERVAECTVIVSAGLYPYGIIGGVQFNKGYLSNGSPAGTDTDNDVHTDRFDVTEFVGKSLNITLLDVKITGANSRICYYTSSGTYISQTTGANSGSNVVITSTVPSNAAFAAISIARSNGFSGIEITCEGSIIGQLVYEGVKTA